MMLMSYCVDCKDKDVCCYCKLGWKSELVSDSRRCRFFNAGLCGGHWCNCIHVKDIAFKYGGFVSPTVPMRCSECGTDEDCRRILGVWTCSSCYDGYVVLYCSSCGFNRVGYESQMDDVFYCGECKTLHLVASGIWVECFICD